MEVSIQPPDRKASVHGERREDVGEKPVARGRVATAEGVSLDKAGQELMGGLRVELPGAHGGEHGEKDQEDHVGLKAGEQTPYRTS